MTLTTHAIIGAAAASLFPEHPYVAFAAGFASHLVIDAIPHWDYDRLLMRSIAYADVKLETNLRGGSDFLHDMAIVGLDALLGFAMTFVVARILHIPPELALVGAGAGIFPDFLSFIYLKFHHYYWIKKILYPLQSFHAWVQWKELKYINPLLGAGMQVALIVAVLAILLVR